MKQKRRKNFQKIGIIFLGISLIFTNCQKDDQSVIDESQLEQTVPLVLSYTVPFEQTQHFNRLKEKIDDIKEKANEFNSQNRADIEDIEILTDEVLYITYASTHTYSFKVLREQPQAFIENVILHYNIETEDYDEYFVQYHVPAEEFVDLYNGDLLQSSENVTITNLESGFFESNTQSRGCARVCQTIFVSCSSGAHTSENIGQWVNCTEDERGGTLPYTFQSCSTNCDQDNEITPPPGGSSGGGGGGNTTVVTNPVPNQPCTTASGQTGIVSTDGACLQVNSTLNPPTVDDKNCDELQKLFATPNYPITPPALSPKAAIANLKSLISPNVDQNNDQERGYNLLHNASLNASASWVNNTSSRSVRYRFSANNYGGCHLHPNDGKGHPFFSPEDILNLWKFYSTYNNGTVVDPSLFVHVMVSTKGVYAIKIDNPLFFQQLQAIYNDYNDANGDGIDKVKIFSRPLERAYEKHVDSNTNFPNGTDSDYQRAFLKFMNNFDGNGAKIGISLYKANNDLTNWSKLTFNESTNVITPTPCD